jgi:uncharacterized protein YraI
MRLWLQGLVAILVLAISAGATLAREAKTISEVRLRTGPNAKYHLITTIPPETIVYVVSCGRAYCRIDWNGYSGFGRTSALQRTEWGPVTANDARIVARPQVIPIYPPYPYRAGHYPKADWYHDLPPYTAISPKFYRKRFFMMAQERNRYRYMPHIFSGYTYDDDGGAIEAIDTRGISDALKETYGE